MSVAHQAARGVVWTTGMALASRAIGLLGTLVLTRFIAPEVMGEVVAATAVAYAVNFSTQIGASQYVLLRGDQEPEAIFHVTVLSVALVAVPLLLLSVLAHQIAPYLGTVRLGDYLPGMALYVLIARIGSVPDKLLLRRMRFRTVAVANALGQVVQTLVAITLVATTNLGGMAIVIAAIAQVVVITSIEVAACGTAAWLTPSRLRWARFKEIILFGLPLALATFLYEVARYGDKLVYTRLFGVARTGEYNLAYGLADLPATYVGEQVAGVLLPTLIRVEPERRKNVLVRAIGLLSIVTFPMAVGLGLISVTLVDVLLPDHWQGVAPFLTVLAVLSVFRPVNGLLSQYLVSVEKNRVLLSTEALRAVVLFGGLFVLGVFGPVVAAFAIGIASFAQTCALVHAVAAEGQFVKGLLRAVRSPVLAAASMAVAILGIRFAVARFPQVPEVALLALEITAGALTYAGAMFGFGRDEAFEVVALAKMVLRHRDAA